MEKQARNYGIDLLRIIAMFFVIILHSLGRGGILRNVVVDSAQYKFAWLLEIIAYCAVDIFALVSGYVSYDKKSKTKNYINLWFQVVFYSLVIVLLFQIINPSIITEKDYIRSFFPVINDTYWYFTAFTGLFILKPLLDKAINNIETKDLKKIFVMIILIFSLYSVITKNFALGKIGNGYSVIWLVVLYILGAIINKCEIGKNMKPIKILVGMIILILITYLVKVYGTNNIKFMKDTFNLTIDRGTLIDYTSPTILGVAILFIIGFSKMKFKTTSTKIITFGATSAFTIYLLNTHYLVWDNYMLDIFKSNATSSVLEIGYKVIGFSLLFVVGAILIDKIRMLIFKVLRIDKLIEIVSNFLDNCITKVSNSI